MIRLTVALALVFVFVLGCGSSPTPAGTGDDMSFSNALGDLLRPAPSDLVSGADIAYNPPTDGGPFQCGNVSCGNGTRCCVFNGAPMCATSCPDGGFTAECKGPENCGGNPCCITIGSGFQVQSVTCTMHPTDCPPMVSATTQSGMDRACRVDGDCTSGVMNASLPDCCTNKMTSQKTCFNKGYLAVPAIAAQWSCP